MRNLMIGLALAAGPAAALAQASAWGAFESGTSRGVGLAAADGAQLLLKCDKPGKGELYATVFTPSKLVPPSSSYQMRAVKFRFDTGGITEDRWRFYTQTAVAIDKGNERSLSRFLAGLGDATKLKITLEPGGRDQPVDANFDVAGAKDAIAQAYEACQDTLPAK